MNRDSALHGLGGLLAERADAARADWANLALVIRLSNGNTDLSGFSYDLSGKAEPAGAADLELFEAIDSLRDAMAASDHKAPWVAALIRMNRASGEITADFDYDDPDRWSVDLGNLAASADRLRPS